MSCGSAVRSAACRIENKPTRAVTVRVLVLAEDQTDGAAIGELLHALCGQIGEVVVRRQPLYLRRGGAHDNADRAAQLVAVAGLEEAKGHLDCVFVHRDCDCFEPDHIALADRIEAAMAAAGLVVHAVVPAWEIEAWWLQWPEVTASVRATWRAPTEFLRKDVGQIENAKEALRSALRPRGRAANRRRDSDYRPVN